MTDDRDRDLQDVLRAERSRGRKQRVDIEEQRSNRQRKERIVEIYRSGNEEELRQVLREWKYRPDEIEGHVKLFRSLRGL
jgi:hypothetical protein